MNLRNFVFTGTAVALLTLTGASVWAQTPTTPRVDQREANQEKRIEQGVASGALTSRETLRLEREQKRVAAAEAQAKGDGTVTAAERKRLHKLQNAASRDIKHQKHDAQVVAPVTK
jgi:hypothetical protein